MPRPSHRLDLVVVSAAFERAVEASTFEGLVARWNEAGVLEGNRPGAEVDRVMKGGFARMWRDDPGRVHLYANQQGGFRVRCPKVGENVVPAFSAALEGFRRGGPFEMHCPVCSCNHSLSKLDFHPGAAFARGAVVFADAVQSDLSPWALCELGELLGAGGLILVRRRV